MLQTRFQSFLIYGTRVSLVCLFILILLSLIVFPLTWLNLVNLVPIWLGLTVSCYSFMIFSVFYTLLVPYTLASSYCKL